MAICVWTKPELNALLGSPLQSGSFESFFNEVLDHTPFARLLYVDQRTWLPDGMLTKVDRASMAVGLEVRVPLLDHRVVEMSSKLPDSMKYRNGTTKYLLKKLLSRYIPKHLIDQPKKGFGAPLERWLRSDLKELLLDYLSPDRLQREGLFNKDIVLQMIKEHLEGTRSHHYRLWSLLMWEMWQEHWLNR